MKNYTFTVYYNNEDGDSRVYEHNYHVADDVAAIEEAIEDLNSPVWTGCSNIVREVRLICRETRLVPQSIDLSKVDDW